MTRVLVVHEENAVRRQLVSILGGGRFAVTEADNVSQAQRAVASRDYEVVVTGKKLQDGDGMAVLWSARKSDPSLPVVFVGANASSPAAGDALRAGAFDTLAPPLLPDRIRVTVARAAERFRLRRENEALRSEVRRHSDSSPLVGSSASMTALRQRLESIAPTEVPVLVVGEAGTGKERVGRALHASSRRAGRLFVALPCAGPSETPLRDEIFGSRAARAGAVEAAGGGTLFLDEVAAIPPDAQDALLEILGPEGDGRPAGRHDVRLVAATRHDLAEDGRLREDLRRRFDGATLRVPPLRERLEDLPALASEILGRIARDLKLPAAPVPTPAALERLAGYEFPGNVRELKNVLEGAALASGNGCIEADHIEFHGGAAARGGNGNAFEEWIASLPESFDLRNLETDVERVIVRRALAASAGVAAQAARKLGLSRSDLAYKLRRLGIVRTEH
jgi:DNA-binding NtrC family response regulator